MQRHTLAYFGFWIVTQRQRPTGLPNDRKETQHTTFGVMLPTDDLALSAKAGSTKQQSDPTPAEDAPASKYARLQWVVIIWLVCDNVLITFASLGKKRVRDASMQMEMLLFPISLSLCMLYAFGTLDSSAVRARAVGIWGIFMLYQAVFSCIGALVMGFPLARGLMLLIFFTFVAAAFGWLIGVLRDELRALRSLDATRVKRLFEIMGIQAALVIIGATQGIGEGELPRIGATGLFSMTLTMAWLFSLACFDVMGIDVTVAGTLLQLRPIEGAALFFIGILVLSGLAAYVISEQNKPSRTAVKAVFDTFSVAMVGAYFCTARIIWVARRKRRSKVSDDDPPA